MVKKVILIFGVRRFLSQKNRQMCHQISFSQFSQKTLFFFLKFCRIKKYSTYQNNSLLIHFLRQRFFDVLLWVVKKHNKHKLFTSRAVMHCCIARFMWNICCYFSSHVNNRETTMVFEKSAYPSLGMYIFKSFLIKIDRNWSELKKLNLIENRLFKKSMIA